MENTLSEQTPSKLDACLDLCREGAGDVEIAEQLSLTMKQFRGRCESNEAFRTFVDKGSTIAQAWWWRQGRTNLKNKNFLHGMWAFNMKNRYGWAEKTDTTTTGELDLDINQMQRQLSQALKELGKKSPELVRQLNVEAEYVRAS